LQASPQSGLRARTAQDADECQRKDLVHPDTQIELPSMGPHLVHTRKWQE
jgi:hypothetical protein